MEGVRYPIESARRVGGIGQGCLLGFPRSENDFARSEEFGITDQGGTGRRFLHGSDAVAAEAEVGGPDRAGAVAESPGTDRREEGRVVPGATVTVLTQPSALAQGLALGMLLPTPAAREIEDLRRSESGRKGSAERLQDEVVIAVIAQGRSGGLLHVRAA